MSVEVNPVRRAYHSPLRAGQASRTRQRVLETALRLFADRGYAATTVGAVADAAGVSRETVYLAVGNKRALLEAVIESAITGPEDSPSDDDHWWDDLDEVADASDRLARIVEFSCRVLARTSRIHAVIRGAADKEAFASVLGRRLLRERLETQTERIRRYFGSDLVPGLSVGEAGERYCALTSPELFHLLTEQLGWNQDHHQRWVTEVLRHELLG